jgi:hypothetical protein
VQVPTLVLHGAEDGDNLPETTEGKDDLFAAEYERRVLEGVGHFPPREAPGAVADAVVRSADRDPRVSRRTTLGSPIPWLGKEANAVRKGESPTRRELEAQARRLDIKGRSKMGKAELKRAVARGK